MLSKSLGAAQGSQFAIYGHKHSGRHALIASALRSGDESCIGINTSEMFDGKEIDAKKLCRAMRIVSSVVFKESLKIVEGEVVGITSDRIHLKTKDMESTFEIGARMRSEIHKERVSIGDIIRIYKESGFVNRIGRSASSQASSNPGIYPAMAPPEGECIKTETLVTRLTLDELDLLNYKENGEEFLYTNLHASKNVRSEVGRRVLKWMMEGKATFLRGFLVIDDSQALSEDAFVSIMSIAREQLSPSIIFVFDGMPAFRNHGELRLFIVQPDPGIVRMILQSVARSLHVALEDEHAELLRLIAVKSDISVAIGVLRSAMQSNRVGVESINHIDTLFDFHLK